MNSPSRSIENAYLKCTHLNLAGRIVYHFEDNFPEWKAADRIAVVELLWNISKDYLSSPLDTHIPKTAAFMDTYLRYCDSTNQFIQTSVMYVKSSDEIGQY